MLPGRAPGRHGLGRGREARRFVETEDSTGEGALTIPGGQADPQTQPMRAIPAGAPRSADAGKAMISEGETTSDVVEENAS